MIYLVCIADSYIKLVFTTTIYLKKTTAYSSHGICSVLNVIK